MVELRRYRLQAGYVGSRSTSGAQSRFFTRFFTRCLARCLARSLPLPLPQDTVPKALAAFEAALPAKIEAARSAGVENEVEMLMYSDVGRLNELVEVWRFERASDTMRAREASRAVPVWRECIQTLTGLTESFDSSFLYEC